MFTTLFTAIGRRVELIKAFKDSYHKHNIDARVIGVDANPSLAAAAFFLDQSAQLSRFNEVGYIQNLLQICKAEKVSLLIPLYENEFTTLAQYREEFKEFGTLLLLSTNSALQTCEDKLLTHQFFQTYGFKTPQTYASSDFLKNFELPLIVKPITGMGSQGISIIKSKEQLHIFSKENRNYFVQQFITGTEYTLDILADLNGKVISVVPRERIEVRSGEVSKSRTVKRDDLIEEGKQIVETLGVIGPVTLQCIDTGQEVYWIEINPRFGGGVPLSIAAGVDYPFFLYQMCTGQAVKPIIGEFKDNLTMLRYDQSVYF